MPDPLWINASAGAPAYSANELRGAMALAVQYNGRTLGARAGVRPGGNALQTSIAGSTITVRAGTACVDPALTTAQGPYWVCLPADETHTLTAAHATLPRKDITVLRVYDHDEDSSTFRKAQSEYIVGTAAGSPAEPSVPSGSFKISTIDVPNSGGGSPSVTLNYPYTVASGGTLPVRNVTERTAITPFDGMVIERQDRSPRWLELYDGTAWRVITDAVCSSTSDRDTAITNPYTGQRAFVTADLLTYRYTGSAWVVHGLYRQTTLLGADAASVTLSSIPSTLKRLAVTWTARSTAAAVFDDLRMRINGNTGTNYFGNLHTQQNTTISSFAEVSLTYGTVGGGIAAASAAASNFGSGEVTFTGWNAPASRPALNWLWAGHMFESAANSFYSQGGGLFIVAGPYTSLTFLAGAGNLKAGSEFTVYGSE